MMERVLNRQMLWNCTIALTVIGAVWSTIYSLTHGILDVFPFLYFMPIILVVYFYPKRAVMFSLLLSATYICIVYFFGFSDPKLVAVSTAWFVIFVTIGVVTSSFAIGLRAEERKFQRIFENSQAGIFTFDCRTLILKEINEKCARLLRYERSDLLGRDLSAILPESTERDKFILALREKSVTGDVELQFTARDGTLRQFLVTASIVPNYTAICSAIDITERKLAEKVIQKAREELGDPCAGTDYGTHESKRGAQGRDFRAETFRGGDPACKQETQYPLVHHPPRHPQPDHCAGDVSIPCPRDGKRSCHQ